MEFVDGGSIDARCYADCYFLTCEDTGAKAFALFLKAMEKTNLVAIAKLTYREREHLSAIRAYDGVMLPQTLHYADELRPYDELKPRQVELSDKKLAIILCTTHFERIPDTISSRCQLYLFSRLKPDDIKHKLGLICEREWVIPDSKHIKFIVENSRGNMRSVENTLEQICQIEERNGG